MTSSSGIEIGPPIYAVVAVRVADLADPATGSTVCPCKACGAACWLAPSSDAKAPVVCRPCLLDALSACFPFSKPIVTGD